MAHLVLWVENDIFSPLAECVAEQWWQLLRHGGAFWDGIGKRLRFR